MENLSFVYAQIILLKNLFTQLTYIVNQFLIEENNFRLIDGIYREKVNSFSYLAGIFRHLADPFRRFFSNSNSFFNCFFS